MRAKQNATSTAIITETFDSVTIRPFKPGRCMLDFPMPDGKRQRPIIRAADHHEAVAAAKKIVTVLEAARQGTATECPLDVVARLQGKPPKPVKRPDTMTIPDALEQAVEVGSQARPTWKEILRNMNDLFVAWLKINEPDLPNDWQALSYATVQRYMNTLAHLSKDTISHRLAPIRLAARYWSRQKPGVCFDFTAGILLPEGKATAAILALTPVQALQFLDRLQRLQPAIYPIAALGIFAGLRVSEAAALRLCDVDLQAATLTVTDTGSHIPKNRGSYRTLPLCQLALDVLRKHMATAQPVLATEPLFVSSSGSAWVNRMAIDSAWKRFVPALAKENGAREKPERFLLPTGYTLRGNRRTFATATRKAGAPRDLLQHYLGQAAKDVLGLHYDAVDVEDLKAVATACQTGFSVNDLSTVAKPAEAETS